MKRIIALWIVCCSLGVVACSEQSMRKADTVAEAGLGQGSAPRAAAAAVRDCVAPRLVVDSAVYAASGDGIRAQLPRLQAMFETQYHDICGAAGGDWRLIANDAAPARELFVLNAPDANMASLYRQDAGRVVLEYPFENQVGQVRLPTLEALRIAIVCASGVATEFGFTDNQCLPD